jgi:hypothetical protein
MATKAFFKECQITAACWRYRRKAFDMMACTWFWPIALDQVFNVSHGRSPGGLGRVLVNPRKRTWFSTIVMSALCQKQTLCPLSDETVAIRAQGVFVRRGTRNEGRARC